MIDIDFGAYNLDKPEDRRAVLSSIPPDRTAARKFQSQLLEIFRKEMSYRKAGARDDEKFGDHFEQIYWCALLLYLAGDPADAPLLWAAKQIDFDLGCSFDGQFLVGGGIDETMKSLTTHCGQGAAEYVQRMIDSGDLEDLPRWEQFRIHYFYP